jgi:hypothetical protein
MGCYLKTAAPGGWQGAGLPREKFGNQWPLCLVAALAQLPQCEAALKRR